MRPIARRHLIQIKSHLFTVSHWTLHCNIPNRIPHLVSCSLMANWVNFVLFNWKPQTDMINSHPNSTMPMQTLTYTCLNIASGTAGSIQIWIFHKHVFILCRMDACQSLQLNYIANSHRLLLFTFWLHFICQLVVATKHFFHWNTGSSIRCRKSSVGSVWRTLQTNESLCSDISEAHPSANHIC